MVGRTVCGGLTLPRALRLPQCAEAHSVLGLGLPRGAFRLPRVVSMGESKTWEEEVTVRGWVGGVAVGESRNSRELGDGLSWLERAV